MKRKIIKLLKVEVTGMIEYTFTGNEKEVEKYLTNLKQMQISALSSAQAAEYKSFPNGPPSNKSHRINHVINQDSYVYKEAFRESTKDLALNIKIRPFIASNDKFF